MTGGVVPPLLSLPWVMSSYSAAPFGNALGSGIGMRELVELPFAASPPNVETGMLEPEPELSGVALVANVFGSAPTEALAVSLASGLDADGLTGLTSRLVPA
jgi:hypothetical protein